MMNRDILDRGITQALNGIFGEGYVITNVTFKNFAKFVYNSKDEKSQLPHAELSDPIDVDNIFAQFYQRVINPDKTLQYEDLPEIYSPVPRPKPLKRKANDDGAKVFQI